jgi:CheY-like chemotaxis protein
LETLKSRLRVQAGRIAPSSVVEAYISVLEQYGQGVGSGRDIFIVGEGDLVSASLLNELRSHGFRIMESENLQEARKAYLRRRPADILLHVDPSRSAVEAFCRYIREEAADPDTALLAITRRNEPSFLLNLMDTWFNDVLPLPIDAPVAVARISRALSHKEKEVVGHSAKGFSATFKDLPFVDLVQTLTSGGRDVRMVVDGPGGKRAEIYFREGKIVFAVTGDIEGPDVVYEVIMWQGDGVFRVEPASVFPDGNVDVPTDYILLEGLRRLDEGLAGM